MLHDPAVRATLEARLDTLRPDSERRWGAMSVDQMLWHVNQFIGAALGDDCLTPQKMPVPLPVMRFLVLRMPFPKSAPTNRSAVATAHHDFVAERARCRALLARFAAKPLTDAWPVDPTWGAGGGRFASRILARHLDHHLRQFGA
ncbi:MAG: hypothetical protein KGN74_07230 [Gemmatimonadota bacterium]|nr:hypothetical protein [Gemmatimonadota bacterium]